MAMQKHAETIKADEVLERARKVAGRLVEREFGQLDPGDVRIGWHPGHGTVGLIIQRDALRDLSADKGLEMADTIAREFDGIALGGSHHFTYWNRYLIMGFFPLPMLDMGGFR